MEKSCVSGGQCPHALRVLSQLTEQHCEDIRTRIIVAVLLSELGEDPEREKWHVGRFRSNRSSARDDSTSSPAVPAAFGRASSWREIFEIAPPPRSVTTRTSAYIVAPRCSTPSHGPACKHSCESHAGGRLPSAKPS